MLKFKIALAATMVVAMTGGSAWAQQVSDKEHNSSVAAVGETAAVYVPIVPCRVVDTRSTSATGANRGPFAPNEVRQLRAHDGAGYAQQGGVGGECNIGSDSVAIEAAVTAIAPTKSGYLRAWPTGSTPPNATFLNYTAGVNITNTGAISVSENDSLDLSVKNFGGTTHYVIDIQGYYAAIVG